MTDTTRTARPARPRSPVQYAALAFGVVFLLVGIAGFIPGITTAYDTMQFAGHHSEAMLLGLFQVSILHNIVHLLYGVVGLLMARTASQARIYLLAGGAVYLVLWIYGLVIGHDSSANFVPLNTADNWLHFLLGIAMVALSFLHRRQPRRAYEIHDTR
ncbi:DUF4383 domain-containing protein [Dietzia sp. B32]|uniref:DUF4383 domain-containing protein n=1 Tax=Dietzia sp. B32 TaxID=2915130 RepID=UPI0021ADF76D|nr:DUF4383 domain-containing protein [Dietzia sp. B32]UVE93786.1 DUF4383 domain-containing protein [Dietzia sp. B32]